MKSRTIKLIPLLFLAGFILFTSCEKKDNDSIDSSKIIGLWTLGEIDAEVKVNGKTPADFIKDELGLSGALADNLINEIKNDIEEDSDMPATIDFKADGSYEVVLKNKEEDDGEWKLNGNILLIDEGTVYETEMTVITLTANKLTVKIEETEMEDLTDDGTDEKLEITLVINYTK